MELNTFLQRFDNVKQTGERQYIACCPAHSDSTPSLCIGCDDKKILVHCQAHCDIDSILKAVNLERKNLYFNEYSKKTNNSTFLREHFYTSEDGSIIAKKRLYKNNADGKKWGEWYRLNGDRYIKGLNGMKMPLYHADKLINSSGVIYIAEGEKDVETLEKMDLIATTSPNGAGSKWSAAYNKYFENKDVVILADNDVAGEKHAEGTARALLQSATTVKLVKSSDIYPDVREKGDISDIVAAIGIEKAKEQLFKAVENTQQYINSHISEKAAIITPESDLPPFIYEKTSSSGAVTYAVNRPLLAKYIREHEKYFFLDTNGDKPLIFWYNPERGIYEQLSDNGFKGIIKAHIENFNELCVKNSDLEEVYKLLITDRKIVKKASELDNDEIYICFENGLLNIDTLTLHPHTPDVISTIQIPCKWNPNAKNAPQFESFLTSLTNGNNELSYLLMQFMGLVISNIPGYITKQALFLYGPGNTGKSQFLSLLVRLIGQHNCASIDLKELEERFGTSCIWRKRLAGCPDMSAMKIGELKMFKKLTGGDEISFEHKGKDRFSDTYKGTLLFCANELPKFGGDKGSHVYDRMILVNCSNVIPEDKRDGKLLDKLYSEREAIVYNAVTALKIFKAHDCKFLIPSVCETMKKSYMVDNDNVLQFCEDCTIDRAVDSTYKDLCTTSNIYKAYVRWTQFNGLYTQNRTDFQKSICQKYGKTDISECRHKYNGNYYYHFTLTKAAKHELLGYIS